MDDKTQIVPANSRMLAGKISEDMFGYDELPAVVGAPSFIKLCQHSTQKKPEGVNNGDFFDDTLGTNYGKELSFYVVHIYNPRIKYNKDKTVACSSRDGITGTERVTGLQRACDSHADCNWECEANVRCNKQVGVIMMLKGGGLPSVFMFDKLRYKKGWDLIKKLNSLKIQNQAAPKDQRMPLMFYRFKIKSRPTVVNGFAIQDIDIFNDGVLDDANEAEALIQMKQIVQAYVSKIEEAQSKQIESDATQTTKNITNY